MRAIRVSDVEAKLILSMKELNEIYIYSKRHFICGALISSLGDHLKLKSIDPEVNTDALMYYSDAFDWSITTKSFHRQWVEYIGAESSHWNSYFTDWNKGTKYQFVDWDDEFGISYRKMVLGECAEADPEYEFCIDMKISPEYFDGCIQFEVTYES